MTIKNRCPLPLIQETLTRLQNARWYTKQDLRDGYYHPRISEGEEWKTAFWTRYGHFEYQAMLFGHTNAPRSFQHFINDTIRDFLDIFCIAFLDDILIYSSTPKEDGENVRLVLERLSAAGIHLKTREVQVPRPRGGLSRPSHHPEWLEDARREGGLHLGLEGPGECEGCAIFHGIRELLPAIYPQLLQSGSRFD